MISIARINSVFMEANQLRFPGLLLNDLLLMRKSRAFVLLLFLLPLVLALISTITSESGGYTDLKIAIVNEDKTFIGLFFLQYATSMLKGENIVQLSSRDQIDGMLEYLDGVFVIPRGFANKLLFQEPSELIFIPNPGSMQTAVAIYQVLNNVLKEFKALPVVADPEFMKGVEIDPEYVAPVITVEGIRERKLNFSSLLFPMVLSITIMFVTSVGAASGTFEDRRNGMIDLLKLSNLSGVSYMAAKTLSFSIFSTMQVLVFLLMGKMLGLDVASNIFLYLLVIEVYIVLFTSIGLSIGMVFSSSRSAQLTSVTLVTALLILSGTIIPHSMFPDWLGIFSKNLPTTRLMVSLQGVSMLDFTIGKVLYPVLISLLISISLIFLSSFMYSRESITMAE